MCHCGTLVPQRKIWRPFGYDIQCGGHLLCTRHCRYLPATQGETGHPTALQSIRLPGAPDDLHRYGYCLHGADGGLQTDLYMVWYYYRIARCSRVLRYPQEIDSQKMKINGTTSFCDLHRHVGRIVNNELKLLIM